MRSLILAVVTCSTACLDVAKAFDGPDGPVTRRQPPPAPVNLPPVQIRSAVLRPDALKPRGLPPISGGTLLATADGTTLVAADPESDVVWFADAVAPHAVSSIELLPGDEPGRLVEDGAGRLHVVLRRAGEIATLQRTPSLQLVSRRAVCPEPRGLAWDATTDALLVACTDGRLMSMPAAGGDASLVMQLDDDLRDVVLSGTDIVVSRFRAAELLTVSSVGSVTKTHLAPGLPPPPSPNVLPGGPTQPEVLWRTVAVPGGGLLISHQNATTSTIVLPTGTVSFSDGGIGPGTDGGFDTGFGAYGGSCTGIVSSTVSWIRPDGTERVSTISGALPVDVALSASGNMAVVSAGSSTVQIAPLAAVGPPAGPDAGLPFACPDFMATQAYPVPGKPVAVAFLPGGSLVTQLRSPPGLSFDGLQTVRFPNADPSSDGHTLFHTETSSGLACASCHPEGRDDGHVFQFAPGGARRTQNLTGGLLATAPFHWDGAFSDVGSLMLNVFVLRMGGPVPSAAQSSALEQWLDTIPRPAARPAADAAAAERGRGLFQSAEVGCAVCHLGRRLSNNANENVGTGGVFQVPSLTGVVARAPYLHDGCAQTLEERFTCGGGDQHGHTSQLSTQQLADLVAYLKTL